MDNKLQILCGFENEAFEEALVKELKREGHEAVLHVRYSKESVKEFLEKNTGCGTVILTEKMGKVKYTAEELAQLTDKRDVNVVVIISPRLKGTEFVKTLYTANITGAIFQEGRGGVGPRDVAEQIVNRRSRKDARVYYGIEGQKLDMGTLDEDTYVEYYNRLTNGDFILKNYIDLCVKMTPQQIADFTKRLPKETLSELGKYEEFYLIVDLLREFKIDLKIKKPKKVAIGFSKKPQLGMSEGGLTFSTPKVEEPMEEPVKEDAVSPAPAVEEVPNDISSVDDIFAMLDGDMPAPKPQKVTEVEVKEPEPKKEEPVKEGPVEKPADSEAERMLQERLLEAERLLAEERNKAAASEARVNRIKAAYDKKEEENEVRLRKLLEESVASERDLALQHEKEMRELQKKKNAMEKEMVKRGIYDEDDDGEDVYLTAGGPQFSVGVIVLIVLVVVAVFALIFLKPWLMTMGM